MGIAAIDRQLDGTARPQNFDIREHAAGMLIFIGQRPDGPELLRSQIDRLTSMAHDSSEPLADTAGTVLFTIGCSPQ